MTSISTVQISHRSLSKCSQTQSSNKTWAITKDKTVKIESLTDKTINGALKIIRECFVVDDMLCTAVGILEEPGAVEELIATCVDAAKDGVSFVAIDTEVNKVIGVLLNKIQVQGNNYYEKLSQNSKCKASKAFFDFTIDLDNRADVYNRYNVHTVIENMYGAMMPEYRKQNIGQLLVESTFVLGKQLKNGKNVKTPIFGIITNLDAIPDLVTAFVTSNIGHKGGEKMGFDIVFEASYDNFVFNGRKFSEKIGDAHKTCRVLAKRIC